MSKSIQAPKDNFSLDIPILSGSEIKLTKFDFSFKKIRILDIQSKKFESYIRRMQPELEGREIPLIKHIAEDIYGKSDKKYAVVPQNPEVQCNQQDLVNVWRFLLIIYPSDLQIQHVIHYYYNGKAFDNPSFSSYHRRRTGEYPGNLLNAEDLEISEVNQFAKKYFDRLNLDNYVGFAIEKYITSFHASHYHYQYLDLCIALESIIVSHQVELSYRLKRTVAILCGKNLSRCDHIFKQLTQIYGFRSTIVHGGKFDDKDIEEYLEVLQAIVSRTLIELIIHNIATTGKLAEIITSLGFGDREKISTGWKGYKLNHYILHKSNWGILKK